VAAPVAGLELVVQPGATLTVQVEGPGGGPLEVPFVSVQAQDGRPLRSQRLQREAGPGPHRLAGLPPGETVRVISGNASFGVTWSTWIRLEPGAEVPVRLRLSPDGCRLQVVASRGGVGVPRVRVSIRDVAGRSLDGVPGWHRTNQQGSYLTEPYPGGRSYQVQVTPPEGEPLTRTVTLPPGPSCLQVLFELP
jgi:hypothetical protein